MSTYKKRRERRNVSQKTRIRDAQETKENERSADTSANKKSIYEERKQRRNVSHSKAARSGLRVKGSGPRVQAAIPAKEKHGVNKWKQGLNVSTNP